MSRRQGTDAGLPPGQALAAPGKWPVVGERTPRADDSPWRVSLAGLVERPQILTLDELAGLGTVERTIDIHCVTRWSQPGMRFKGVPLSRLLERAGVASAARFVSFVSRSSRAHSTSLPLTDALTLDVLVALEADGAPLTSEHGGPVRTITPGRYFYKSLKWLETIELLAEDRLGYWEAVAGYHNHAEPFAEERYIATNLDRREVAALLASRTWRDRDLLSLVAVGVNLDGLDAELARLRNADLSRASLQRARFTKANLSNARLIGADLRAASFAGADLEGADFRGADLRGADLSGAALAGASFTDEATDAPEARHGTAVIDAGTTFTGARVDGLSPTQAAWLAAASASAPGR